jgi:hypothetical protein
MRSTRMVAPVITVLVGLFAFSLSWNRAWAQKQKPAAPPAAPEQAPDDDAADDDDAAGSADAGAEARPAANPEDAPVNLRLRRLEQRVQELKERAWRSKARVGMLKEAILGGGVGARATLIHHNKMGRAFTLVKAVYAVDGTQIFARTDESGELQNQKKIDLMSGPIAPGNHTISVLLVYRGSGFGPFKYLKQYKFTVKSSHTFTAVEGKQTRIEIVGFEKGGWSAQLRDRPSIDFRVNTSEGEQ